MNHLTIYNSFFFQQDLSFLQPLNMKITRRYTIWRLIMRILNKKLIKKRLLYFRVVQYK